MRFEILTLFVNTLNVNDKYSRHYGENFAQPIQKQLSKKQNAFTEFFSKFITFWQKGWASLLKCFRYSWLQKMRWLECLKGPFWEQLSGVNVLTSTKHSWNVRESYFILLSHHSQMSWVGKGLSSSDLKP